MAGDAAPKSLETASLEAELNAAERMIFFSDAVVAIAMTLLAFNLPLPHGFHDRQLLDSLGGHPNRAAYQAFLVSFVVIGSHWAAHRRLFRYMVRLGGHVALLNMLWLLMMIIVPFATRVLAGPGAFGVRFSFYALIQVIAWMCLYQMTRELVSYRLLRPGTPPSVASGESRLLLLSVMFLISIPIAFFTSWAYLVWIATPLVARTLRWSRARRAARLAPGS